MTDRTDSAIRADLAAIASRDWLTKDDDERIYRLAGSAAPLLARAVAAEARAETAEKERDEWKANAEEFASRLAAAEARAEQLTRVVDSHRAANAGHAKATGEARARVAAVEADVEKLRGDVHHLVQPIIGHLRWLDHKKEPLATEHVEHAVDRLRLVLGLMDEAATGEPVPDEQRGRHGVGLNHYPALAAASPPEEPKPQNAPKPERCKGTLGDKPSWMSEGQFSPCRCELSAGHDGECQCEHTRPETPAAASPPEDERLRESMDGYLDNAPTDDEQRALDYGEEQF